MTSYERSRGACKAAVASPCGCEFEISPKFVAETLNITLNILDVDSY